MIALSPGLSWIIFGGWIVGAVMVVAWMSGATRKDDPVFDASEWAVPEWRPMTDAVTGLSLPPPPPYIRVTPGPYDWERAGDFDD